MAKNLYNTLSRLDRGIASAYKRAVGADASGKISVNEADRIFKKAIDNKKISPKEAKALNEILEHARFAKGVKKHLQDKIRTAASLDSLYKGSGELLEDDQLGQVYSAMGTDNVGKINFLNPYNNIRYRPTFYQVICRLIRDWHINVYMIKAHGLNETAGLGLGVYRSTADELYLYSGMEPKVAVPMIVHESTHAIQDWLDIRAKVLHVEADSYIAQAIVAHKWKRTYSAGSKHPVTVAFHGAAKIALDGKANTANPKWKPAYDAVAKAVGEDPLYKAYKNVTDNYKIKGEINERKEFLKLLKAIKKMKD